MQDEAARRGIDILELQKELDEENSKSDDEESDQDNGGVTNAEGENSTKNIQVGVNGDSNEKIKSNGKSDQ